MYIPPAFAETDLPTLHAFVRSHSFGLLVSQHDGEPFATHLPFLLDHEPGTNGVLVGHMARTNPQWRTADRVLVVFPGPHAYISPGWYEAEHVVPTWNYVAVHAYGRFEAIEEPAAMEAIVRRSVELYERNMPRPWILGEWDTFLDRMLKQIVGFRIAVDRWEGKWKLSQNHPPERRARVIRGLESLGDTDSLQIAAGIRAQFPIVQPVTDPGDLPLVRRLFEEYAASISHQVCFEGFHKELDGLPGEFALPDGALWLARTETGEAVGCLGLRKLEDGIGELKRLYVTPAFQGRKLGRKLVETAITTAARRGYHTLRLDSLPSMTTAIALYKKLGFQSIPAYYSSPIADKRFFQLTLTPSPEPHS